MSTIEHEGIEVFSDVLSMGDSETSDGTEPTPSREEMADYVEKLESIQRAQQNAESASTELYLR